MKRMKVSVTTDGSGAASLSPVRMSGFLIAVQINKGTLAATADLTVSDDQGSAILTAVNVAANATLYPRTPLHDVTGTPIAGGYTAHAIDGIVTVTLAQGGAGATCDIYLLVDGTAQRVI